MTEEWRAIPEFPTYAVSNLGRVMRVQRSLRGPLSNKPLKPWCCPKGYGMVVLYSAGRNPRRVHRLVCEAFHGPPPGPDYQAAHEDGNTSNNRADNLSWKTPVENEADKIRHGTALAGARALVAAGALAFRGEQNAQSKLTDDAVRAILADPRSHGKIAADYGVSGHAIWSIKAGKTWRHVV